jgi:hypothetical protein
LIVSRTVPKKSDSFADFNAPGARSDFKVGALGADARAGACTCTRTRACGNMGTCTRMHTHTRMHAYAHAPCIIAHLSPLHRAPLITAHHSSPRTTHHRAPLICAHHSSPCTHHSSPHTHTPLITAHRWSSHRSLWRCWRPGVRKRCRTAVIGSCCSNRICITRPISRKATSSRRGASVCAHCQDLAYVCVPLHCTVLHSSHSTNARRSTRWLGTAAAQYAPVHAYTMPTALAGM